MDSRSLLILLPLVCHCGTAWSSGTARDPDLGRDTQQLIVSRGFLSEEHKITTQDGYIVTAFRIVHPTLNQTIRPVILQHGFPSSSRDWLINSPGGHVDEETNVTGNNLGFELAKRGYDVWLTNARGNTYSRQHVSLKATDSRFWDFSYSDVAKFDVPANVEYVLNVTGRQEVGYVAFSQGTTSMFAALSLYPSLNRVVKPFIALAPIASYRYSSPPVRAFARLSLLLPETLGYPNGPILQNNKVVRSLEAGLCKQPLLPACLLVIGLSSGFDSAMLNQSRLQVYTDGIPAGTSVKNIVHMTQNIRSRKLADYDYGLLANLRIYGGVSPPEFPLHQITNPNIALISGLNDAAAPPREVDFLRSRLRVNLKRDLVIPYKKWGHFDFAVGLEAGKYVNQPVIEILSEFE